MGDSEVCFSLRQLQAETLGHVNACKFLHSILTSGVACSRELVSPEGSAYGCVRICLDEVHLPKQMHSSCWVSVGALLLLPPPVAFLFLESGGDFLLHLGGEEIFCYSHIRGRSSDMVAPKAPDQLGQGLT